jgi:glycosidase
MAIPFWVEDAVFYQIFPDRFANGDPSIDPPNVQPWGAMPNIYNFQGGDLRGIIQKFDYLLDLGINAVYLNPIFQSTSTHRYNATDYLKIDNKLGDLRDFKALLEVAHRHGVRVVLDGVFNHCGRGFFAFNDLLENQDKSPYRDWFHPLHFPIDAFSHGESNDYLAWWKYKSLPKFNTNNLQVRNYLLSVARYWIEQGADGWRLDVPNEIDDDTFWAEFRHTVKKVNPDAYLVGEIWDGDPRWVGDNHFDGLMNYPLRDGILDLVQGKKTTSQFDGVIKKLMGHYPRENIYAMYNLLGSHDTQRLITMCGGDVKKVQLALMLLFSFPGAPAVYYGDEIGIEGGKDPDCRRAFIWEPLTWKHDIHQWVQKLISLRKQNPTLRRGNMQTLLVDDNRGIYIFARMIGDNKIVVAINNSQTKRQVRLPISSLDWNDGQIVHNLLGSGEYIVNGENLSISIPSNSGLWLK